MSTVYDAIYAKAKPYWETRQNNVHVPIAYDFARRLLTHYPEADESIVLPAILLHDVGWKMISEEKQLDAFGPNAKGRKTQRLHETEGVKIAEKILTALNYHPEKTREILAIINGHDTRQKALSLNDELVKDADKLWRFTLAGVQIDHVRFGIPRNAYLAWLDTMIEGWFFTSKAKNMAHQALSEAESVSESPSG